MASHRSADWKNTLPEESGPENWSEEYEVYPNPGETPSTPTIQTVEGYRLESGNGTLGGLITVLNNVKSQFEETASLAERFESIRGQTTELAVSNELRQAIESDFRFPSSVTRETAYEIAPPAPLFSEPGLSVFHDFEVKNVEYRREDPVGWLGVNWPTPIPLWFIGVTLYWAQWDVVLELEDSATEEIFDYANPSIPRRPVEGEGLGTVHKPLAYRQELPGRYFSFRLVVIGLKPFGINYED